MVNRPRLAVVSPFLDKQHGTERCVAEQLERLARDYEIHVYSNRVTDLDPNCIFWHRVPALPGPHLFAYCWWFLANHLWRWWDRRFRGLHFDLTFTPGINCLDADVSAVHIVFAEFERLAREELRLRKASLRTWPRLIHRKIYYRLIIALEKKIYTKPRLTIVCVSSQVAREIALHYRRERGVYVIYNAVDHRVFDPHLRLARRAAARRELELQDRDFVLLLVGNDWKKKGLHWLLEAVARLRDLALKLLVVGRDDRAPYAPLIREMGIGQHVRFLEPAADIVRFYAASDVYVGPSLHDSFAFPPIEAMACGLPVVTSSRNGGAEIISHGTDGFVLQDPADIGQLAGLIKRLYDDQALRKRIGDNAAKTARQYTWDRNAAELRALFEQVIAKRTGPRALATKEIE
jgi:UDP-glucose:(heptosyl)LPS alpha-1,3-glucosyltransferase